MKSRWFAMLGVGASLLLGAGTARAFDGYSGDTGGPPPPQNAESSARWQAVTYPDAASAMDAGWAGDTGGAPPLAERSAKDGAAGRREAAAPASRSASRTPVAFTDRG